YLPDHFKEDRRDILHGAIREIAFGALVSMGDAGFDVSHVPMLVDAAPGPHGVLRGHVARANGHWRSPSRPAEAVAIFQGPHAYVSPSLYPSKARDGKVVPTWNYIAVHAYGTLTFTDDPAALRDIVAKLTDVHEQPRARPWSIDDAPAEYIEKML